MQKKKDRKEGTTSCLPVPIKNLFSLAQPPNTFLTMEWNPISGSKSPHQLQFWLFQIFGDKY